MYLGVPAEKAKNKQIYLSKSLRPALAIEMMMSVNCNHQQMECDFCIGGGWGEARVSSDN